MSGLLQNFLVQRVEKSGLTPYGTECCPRGSAGGEYCETAGCSRVLSPLVSATVAPRVAGNSVLKIQTGKEIGRWRTSRRKTYRIHSSTRPARKSSTSRSTC